MFYNILWMKCSLLNCGSNEILSLLHILRSPVYDIRELAGVEDEVGSMVSSLEREKGVLVDDLRWQGQPLSLSLRPTHKGPGSVPVRQSTQRCLVSSLSANGPATPVYNLSPPALYRPVHTLFLPSHYAVSAY